MKCLSDIFMLSKTQPLIYF